MTKSQSDKSPETIERKTRGYLLNFNIEEKPKEMMEGETEIQYEYEQVFVPFNASKNEIISAIIHNIYPIDDEIATINNYLINPDDAEVGSEYAAYQARRAFAKELANTIEV